jgi:HTH-type transcriptional regulator / antitoxin HigA
MNIHPIHTQAEYKTALKEVSSLIDMDPELGTEQADRLEVLGALVEAYEAKYYIFDSTSGNKYNG